ncbi:MAG: T9SS type A sorting domain-containing protein [Bacteroidales bacterium]|nr:T9SS type A sorting domain-containing protein [Bacteroidales bacterium]
MKKQLLSAFAAMLAIVAFGQSFDTTKVMFYLPFEDNINNAVYNSTVSFVPQAGNSEVSYAEGQFGKAGVFNFSPLLSSGLAFDPKDNFTMATWVLVKRVPGDGLTIVHQLDGGASPGRIHLEASLQNEIPVFGSFTSGNRLDDVTALVADQWYHIANVHDADGGIRYFYVNGVKVNELADGTVESTAEQLVIGARKQLTEQFNLDGMLDDLFLTSQVLDEATISSIMTNGLASFYANEPAGFGSGNLDKFALNYLNGSLCLSTEKSLAGASYKIFNITGQMVKTAPVGTSGNLVSIPVNLQNGVYVIMVQGDEVAGSQKFMVNQ